MGAIVDFIEDAIHSIVDAFVDIVQAIWDEVVMPILEDIFALIGIDDETVIHVQKVSIAIYENNNEDVVRAAIIRAVLKKIATNTNFFPNYMQELLLTKAEIRSYHRYGDSGNYIHGLPDMRVSGKGADLPLIKTSLDTDLGTLNTIISVITVFPASDLYFKNDLQSTHAYLPYNNTLTHIDPYSVSRNDWLLDSPILYDIPLDSYSLPIYRIAEEATFWIIGPGQVTEGDTVIFTVKVNRVVPAGTSVTINFTYTGTAVDGVDYTEIASITMPELVDEIDVSIVTLETININSNFTITLASITNTAGAFETIDIHVLDSVTCTITDDDSLILTMNDIMVQENAVTATIIVKLEQAAAGAFTVDYNFTNITADGGTDYDNTPGTLNFVGTAGETQNIVIPITADLVDDDHEQFRVGLNNSSDILIDITRTAIVTIIDGTFPPPAITITVSDTITKPSYLLESTLIVKYYDNNDTVSEWFYWFYKFSDLTYPNLEATSAVLTGLEMLPVAVLRKDKVSANIDKTAPLYLTTRLLMQKLGLSIDDFITSIESSPDIDAITDTYVNFSLSPNTVNKVVSKMLYFTYYELIVINNLISNTDEYSAVFTEGDVNISVVWTNHEYIEDVVGVIAPIEEYTHTIELIETSVPDPTENDPGRTKIVKTSIFHLRYQKTVTTFDHIKIHNLNGLSAIAYDGFHKVNVTKLGEDNFTIPVSWFVFQQLTAKENMIVYQHICRIDLYALQVQELSWYQTSSFANFFDFVMVVITIISIGTAKEFMVALKSLLLKYAIGELVIWVAKETGNEFLAALVGFAASIYADGGDFSFESLMDPDRLVDLSTNFAENLLLAKVTTLNIENNKDNEIENLDEFKKVEESPITIEFLNYLRSIDTSMFPSIEGQYQFNAVFNYDSLVADYYNDNLKVGVV